MDQKTKDALEASIPHWQENVDAETPAQVNIGARDCPLCQAFDGCRGCPVKEATGHSYCGGTPYFNAKDAYSDWVRNPRSNEAKQAWRKAAEAELDFLISLLPGYEVAENAEAQS